MKYAYFSALHWSFPLPQVGVRVWEYVSIEESEEKLEKCISMIVKENSISKPGKEVFCGT